MKRVTLSIQSKSHPGVALVGYAVVSELNDDMLAFFSTEKFQMEEELQVAFTVGKESYGYGVVMAQMLEQISSGRIMTSLPTEEDPFPARKFYRCYARTLKPSAKSLPESVEESPALSLAPELPTETETVPPIAA